MVKTVLSNICVRDYHFLMYVVDCIYSDRCGNVGILNRIQGRLRKASTSIGGIRLDIIDPRQKHVVDVPS